MNFLPGDPDRAVDQSQHPVHLRLQRLPLHLQPRPPRIRLLTRLRLQYHLRTGTPLPNFRIHMCDLFIQCGAAGFVKCLNGRWAVLQLPLLSNQDKGNFQLNILVLQKPFSINLAKTFLTCCRPRLYRSGQNVLYLMLLRTKN